MRILVTGDRNYKSRKMVTATLEAILEDYPPDKYNLLHGDCKIPEGFSPQRGNTCKAGEQL